MLGAQEHHQVFRWWNYKLHSIVRLGQKVSEVGMLKKKKNDLECNCYPASPLGWKVFFEMFVVTTAIWRITGST